MHHVLEIFMPQVDNVEEAVAQIMAPFDENQSQDDEDYNPSAAFWDFYVIGGRWAGHKMTGALDQTQLDAFYEAMSEKKVTVSGLQCGKQELAPASQIPMVDELWADFFPEYKGRACPLFNHANDQYENDCLYGDVLRVKDTAMSIEVGHVIVANNNFGDEDKLAAITMLETSVWNGVNYQDTTWDGTLTNALELHNEKLENHNVEYRTKHTIQDDWIVVTVDYHS